MTLTEEQEIAIEISNTIINAPTGDLKRVVLTAMARLDQYSPEKQRAITIAGHAYMDLAEDIDQ